MTIAICEGVTLTASNKTCRDIQKALELEKQFHEDHSDDDVWDWEFVEELELDISRLMGLI